MEYTARMNEHALVSRAAAAGSCVLLRNVANTLPFSGSLDAPGRVAVFGIGQVFTPTGLSGMDLLQTAMQYHLGGFGTVFIAATLALFSFSTFLGVLYYARGNVAYLCGDNWWSQTVYKLIALVMLLIGGLQAYTVVWDLGDVGIGLMTIFNMIALYPLSGEAMDALNDYEKRKKLQ